MRIAFVSALDPKDVGNWSGTPHFMFEALKRRGHEVDAVGPLSVRFHILWKIIQRILCALFWKHIDLTRTPFYAKSLAASAKRMINGQPFDLILCPSSLVAAFLEVDTPIITWEDATFSGMTGYYPGKWMNFSARTIRNANYIQQQALSRAALSLFASEWAVESALTNYRVDASRIRFVPFGANIENPPMAKCVNEAIARRATAPDCRLLFVGVDWFRKGGELVLETAANLHAKGMQVRVDIVGCTPPHPVPDYVVQHGFVSKATQSGQQKLRGLYLAAHYLFVPSLAECYGLVFAEAAAFGVPSIARATGGIPSVVHNGENGWALPIDATAEAYARQIYSDMNDRASYAALAKRARQMFEESFNWDSAIRQFELQLPPALHLVR
jgi:glycosyltransferase involved in cell wall biosynthesis